LMLCFSAPDKTNRTHVAIVKASRETWNQVPMDKICFDINRDDYIGSNVDIDILT
jgi:hypothetical protein